MNLGRNSTKFGTPSDRADLATDQQLLNVDIVDNRDVANSSDEFINSGAVGNFTLKDDHTVIDPSADRWTLCADSDFVADNLASWKRVFSNLLCTCPKRLCSNAATQGSVESIEQRLYMCERRVGMKRLANPVL